MRTPRLKGTALQVAVIAAVCATALTDAASASAAPAWWHLTAITRPSYLQPGQGKDEVQEVRLEHEKGPEGEEGMYLLTDGTGEKSTVLSASETPGEVQHQLEAEVYGVGNVRVTAAQAPDPGGKAYRIEFVGALEDQRVALFEVRGVAAPTYPSAHEVVRGRPDGVIVLNAVNLGYRDVEATTQPVTVADVLPAGIRAVNIEGVVDENESTGLASGAPKIECSLGSLSCVDLTRVAPYAEIQVRIEVKLDSVSAGTTNVASVTGGGARPVTTHTSLKVDGEAMPFGVSAYEMRPEEEGGGASTQAGSHPFQLTTTLMTNETVEAEAVGLTKDLSFKLPPGVIGNPEPFTRCRIGQFLTPNESAGGNDCPSQSEVGVARVFVGVKFDNPEHEAGGSVSDLWSFVEPLFNLEPEVGEPARFGFDVVTLGVFVPVMLDTAVRTGGDYGVTVNVHGITQAADFVGSEVTFWGVPGDNRHDSSRGGNCLRTAIVDANEGTGEECPRGPEAHDPPPLLSLPTSCTGPLVTSVEADSWLEPGVFGSFGSSEGLPAMDGCNRLPFAPSLRVTPDGTQGSKPTGLNVDVHVPQEATLNPTGLAESEVRNITVALPEGVAINPAGGDGLEACSEALIGYEGQREYPSLPGVQSAAFTGVLPGSNGSGTVLQPGVNFCSDASKIGTVTIHTPLLPNALEGAVYLGAQEANPFGSLVAMYLVAHDPVSGTLVKLPGVVHLTGSGQVVATFENNPQLPFEDAELHFFGGERAPLSSPSRCGAYTTNASYTPWSGNEAASASSTFEVKSGPDGSPCPGASLPFSPSLTAGTTSIQAGGFSPFTMTMSREDGQQSLQAITLHMPEGLSGLLAGVELCPEAQANAGTCGANSQIGETTVSVGLGGDPFTVTGGKVFITGPYRGASFGLSIVNPAKAGPFDLEHTQANHPACDCLVVRAKLEVNPSTAAITVTSDNEGPYKIPTILEGIPLEIKHVNVTVNRPGFIFNPTDCNKTQITGTLDSAEGASQALAVPFQATNCAVLGFAPKLTAQTSAKTSRAGGASLNVKLAYPKAAFGSQANIASVKVELPKVLPSRLTTLQKACTSEQFHSNPAGCPSASIVGHAKAVSPLVPVPLEGPAYFVSNGNESFPNLIVVLQGYGVTIDLVGDTFISRTGITSSTFKTVPDAPVGSFELNLPEGPYSALAANLNLCKTKKLAMPTEILAQNGAQLKTTTKIQVTGCTKTKTRHKKAKHAKKAKGSTRGTPRHRHKGSKG